MKIFANFVKAIVTTITLYTANTNFVIFLETVVHFPLNYLGLCYLVKLQGYKTAFQKGVQWFTNIVMW